jgi:hypothetical protein
MNEIYPVEQLLQQWLLLPLFADIGMAVLLLRSTRGRASLSLAALLCLFAAINITDVLAESPVWRQAGPTCAVFTGPLLLMFLLYYSGGRRLAGSRGYLPVMVLLPAVLSLVTAVGVGWPMSHPAILCLSATYILSAAVLFAEGFISGTLSGKEPSLIGAAIALLLVSGPIYDYAFSGIMHSTVFPYTAAAAGGMLTYAMLRYKSFSILPLADGLIVGTPKLAIAPGLYLEMRERAGTARAFFADSVKDGVPGLVVTRTHPAAYRRQTGLKRIPVIWLAQSAYEKSLPPGEPEVLVHALRDYAMQCERSVVLLEDLDYLVTNAGLYQTFDLLQNLLRTAEMSGAVFLLSSDLLTDDERRGMAELGLKPLR